MITVTQARENDRTTFCRQFTFNKNGYSNRETAGAIVSGMPVAGTLVSSLPVGSLVRIISDGSPFNMLKVHSGNPNSEMYDESCNGQWMHGLNCFAQISYNNGGSNSYKDSTLDSYAENIFFESLPQGIKDLVNLAKIPYCTGTGGSSIGTLGNGLPRHAFSLTWMELGFSTPLNAPIDGSVLDYYSGLADKDAKRVANYDNIASWYWMRANLNNSQNRAFAVNPSTGGYGNGNVNGSDLPGPCFRPAVILSNESLVSPVPNDDGSYNLIY